MAKQRVRNKNILAFFSWVEEQPAKGKIDNKSWESCAIGKFVPTIGLSMEGDIDAQINSPAGDEEEYRRYMVKHISGRKFIYKLESVCEDFYELLNSKRRAPKTYGTLNSYIKDNFTK